MQQLPVPDFLLASSRLLPVVTPYHTLGGDYVQGCVQFACSLLVPEFLLACSRLLPVVTPCHTFCDS